MAMLIKQELYKIFKRKKTYVVTIGFILLTIFIAIGVKQNADYMKEYNTPEFQVENIKSNIEYMKQDLENIPEEIQKDEKEREHYVKNMQDEIARLEVELEYYKSQINSDIPWEKLLAEKIKDNEEYIEENKSSLRPNDLAVANMGLAELKYLQENNIQPQEDYEFNAFTFLQSLIEQLGSVFLVIGVAVFVADIVSGEWTPPTLKLILTQPISRSKILLSKFIAVVIATIGLILLVQILSFLMIGLLYGFGDVNYPVIVDKVYEWDTSIRLDDGSYPLALVDGSYEIIPMLSYGIRLLLNQGLFIVTITSFVFMISSLVKSSMVSMGASVVSLIGSTIIIQLSGLWGLRKFIFVTYSMTSELISGDLAQYIASPKATNLFGNIVLIAWIAICYLISHIVFTKRDILV